MNEERDQEIIGEEHLENHEDHIEKFQKVLSQKKDELIDENVNDNFQLDEILSEFLSTLMARNYKSALYYCKLILLYEPNNDIVRDFYPLIQEKMLLDNHKSDNYDESENSSIKSESSTEYFSSTSVETENLSSGTFTSEEEDN
ncbi:hypothetical protein CDAR_446951 [Caerostris darwini]|uniref:Glutamate-rich protein 2 n=1 Tax=Caerostris darwini TaxID=1538125 RepID=A0AAV4PVP5_9ARAC|nr:hypothetical protein CDAR_446951 [Caerostris darwini]